MSHIVAVITALACGFAVLYCGVGAIVLARTPYAWVDRVFGTAFIVISSVVIDLAIKLI